MRNGASGQGSDSVQVRQFNERVILTLLRRWAKRRRPISRGTRG